MRLFTASNVCVYVGGGGGRRPPAARPLIEQELRGKIKRIALNERKPMAGAVLPCRLGGLRLRHSPTPSRWIYCRGRQPPALDHLTSGPRLVSATCLCSGPRPLQKSNLVHTEVTKVCIVTMVLHAHISLVYKHHLQVLLVHTSRQNVQE